MNYKKAFAESPVIPVRESHKEQLDRIERKVDRLSTWDYVFFLWLAGSAVLIISIASFAVVLLKQLK